MTRLSERERRHLELAFESSIAIVKLAGQEDSEDLTDLRERIMEGELTFDEAVRIALTGAAVESRIKK